MAKKHIISLAGDLASGKGTISKILMEKLNYGVYRNGEYFRKLAKEHNMTVLEFNEFAEGNDEIDIALDKRQADIANEADDLIVEGRLSAFFVDADYRIWLMTPDDIRAERISYREDKSIDTVIREIKERTASEKKRYQEIHNIDIDNFEIYDLIINTGTFDEQATLDIITKCIEQK